MLFFAAGAFGIINPEEKELCFSGMLHWQEIVGECVCASVRGEGVLWWAPVESQQKQQRGEEGGTEDGGIEALW